MKTTGTNKKVRGLIRDILDGRLIPDPSFQRRLVWSSRHKKSFLETVLRELPFPEVYVAASTVNPETAEGTELLVDGQQRLTTLLHYFQDSLDIAYDDSVPKYSQLTPEAKERFLEYDVVVRDLGRASIEDIKEVFRRINSTKYSLNAMEIHNARYEGAFKEFGEALSSDQFFMEHVVFSNAEVRRMDDVRLCLNITATSLSSYYNRDVGMVRFLEEYADEFPMAARARRMLESSFSLIDGASFASDAIVWNQANFFTLVVELCFAQQGKDYRATPTRLKRELKGFYNEVAEQGTTSTDPDVAKYARASSKSTTDKKSRVTRGEIIRKRLSLGSYQGTLLEDA